MDITVEAFDLLKKRDNDAKLENVSILENKYKNDDLKDKFVIKNEDCKNCPIYPNKYYLLFNRAEDLLKYIEKSKNKHFYEFYQTCQIKT